MKKCPRCERNFFYPTDRHSLCRPCRTKGEKILCSCGGKMQPISKRCEKCHHLKGDKGTSWRGGRCHLKNGYVAVYVDSRHYKFEHVLVMEKKLGRELFEGENVHHRNGVRNDNRPKNLELWIRPQPSGIRVLDAIKWAKEILRRYK